MLIFCLHICYSSVLDNRVYKFTNCCVVTASFESSDKEILEVRINRFLDFV